MAISVFPNSAFRGLPYVAVVSVLLFARVFCASQELPPQFDEVAARAASARDQQNLPLAIQLYKQAEELKPDWQEGWWYLGVLQYGENQYAGATDAFTHLLALAPTAIPAMALRGLCEFETGAYDDALRDLEFAVAHGAANEPRNEQIIRYHLAMLLTRTSRFDDALEQYKMLAMLHAEAPGLASGLGLAGLHVASLPKDIAAPDSERYAAAGHAGYVFLAGDDETADRLFSRLFAQHPTTAGLHFFYGYLLFPHDPEMAGDQFQSELALRPTGETYALRALTLIYDGRFAEAVQPAQRAYAAEPESEIAQVALGRALAETGDTKRGAELLNQVLARDPRNLEAHLGLASIYSRSGNREEAAREREVCRQLAR